jgi:hypothetical protein
LLNKTPAREVVLKKGVSLNLNFAVLLPIIGIDDFWIEGGDFCHRPLFGLIAHPRTAEDVIPHSGENIPHHFLRARLRLGREVFSRIFLSQGLAEELICRLNATFPARLHLRLTPQIFAEESEVLFHDGSGESLGG